MPDINKNIVITPSTNTTNLPNVVFTGGDNVATTLNVLADGSLQFVQGHVSADTIIKTAITKALGSASLNAFTVVDSADAPLFEVRQNGDTIIAGVLTVNGTGTSTFAGDVSIGGSITVSENATVVADFTGTNMTLTGNLVVEGNTTLGNDATVDTTSILGVTTITSKTTKALGSASVNAFAVVDSAATPLFEVRENGDTVIAGVLTVNGTGTSSFAGDVTIGGSLTVEGDSTVTALMSGTDLTLTGNLVVEGNTTLGNAATDTISVVGQVNSSITPITDGTYDLGTTDKRWSTIYADNAIITNFSVGGGEGSGLTGDIIPSVDHSFDLGSTLFRFDQGHISTVNANDIKVVTDGLIDMVNAATIKVFSIVDANATTPADLFSVMQNGDTVIGGVLTVNGTGTSTFAGDVSIGGSLTVEESATITALMSGTDLTLSGNLVVNGNTDLGNAATDTISVVGVVDSNVIPAADATQNLGSVSNRWNDVYVGGTLYSDDITATTVTIAGNLTVTGTTTYLNTETINLADNILILNSNLAADVAPTVNAGFEVNRGSANVGGHGPTLIWDETLDLWSVGTQKFKAAEFVGTFSGGFDTGTQANLDALYVNVTGDSMTGNLTIAGVLSATSKSFVIDHPTKPGLKLRYGSLEGPENGVYVRGQLVGGTDIALPDYWAGLVDAATMTVNLTANGKFQPLYVVSTAIDKVVVAADGVAAADINCFYTIFAERKDVAKLVVEYQEVG
jgi:cytoskeletal protein CcmA (bactofilin family)